MTLDHMSSMESLAESRFESDVEDQAAGRMFSDTLNATTLDEDPRVVVVGEELHRDKELISLIQYTFGLEVILSVNGSEFITTDEKGSLSTHPNLVFVISDFEGGDFNYLNSFTRIVSPMAVRCCARNSRKFPFIRQRRSLYCYSMRSMVFAIDGYSRTDTRRAVNLIHFMGGSARKEYRDSLILVAKKADSTIVKNIQHAKDSEFPVLTLEWIEACWQRRDDPDFDAKNAAVMSRYKLKCFQGLRLFFLGLSESVMDELREKTIENKGVVVQNYREATHAVCEVDFRTKHASLVESIKDFPLGRIEHVTVEWFWKSIHEEQCVREDSYLAMSRPEYRPLQSKENMRKRNAVSPVAEEVLKGRRNNSSSKASLDNSGNTSLPEHMFSSDALDDLAHQKKDKRYQVCMEMLETEENYLRVLKLMLEVYRTPLEQKVQDGEPLLNRGEIAIIFDKIGPLIPVHNYILENLRRVIKHWNAPNSQSLVGKVWADGAADMDKVYKPYVNSYDDAVKVLESCDERSPKFHSFLKVCEANPSCQKNSLKDMLIRPVQRIPSVLLLLRELLKRTEKSHEDFKWVTQAIGIIENVLKKTNESRRHTELLSQLLGVCRDIENFPDDLISSSREFHCRADFTLLEVDGSGTLSKNKKRPVTLFLFNDVVVIAKLRCANNLNLTTSFQSGTLPRQKSYRSFTNFLRVGNNQRKTYKYIETLRFNGIRELFFVRAQGVFFIKVRDSSGEFLCSFQVSQDTNVESAIEFFEAVCQRVVSLSSRREVVLEEMPPDMSRANALPEEEKRVIENTLKSAENLSHSGTIRRPSLRRALSSASMTFTHSFSRLTSRQMTLSNIHETTMS